jgi:carbamoyltransferase
MMRILGLSSFSHNSAAAIVEDGLIKSAIENDKVTGRRTRGLPDVAVRSCFEDTGIRWDSLDVAAVATQPLRAWARKTSLRARLSLSSPIASTYHEVNEIGSLARQLNDLRIVRKNLSAGSGKLVTFNHHLCHAASSFYLAPFDRALIVTADRDGDGQSMTLALGEGNRIRTVRSLAFPHSLAWVYSQVTDLIGFVPHHEEHKTQWLSLQGEPEFKGLFVKMFGGTAGPIPRLDYSFFNQSSRAGSAFSQKFYRETGLPSDSKQLTEDQRKALACSIQQACVEVLAGVIRHFREAEKVGPVCLAGGLFQNALLVSSLEEQFDQVFVPPAAANAGTALGAALLAWHSSQPAGQGTDSSFDVFCGPRFTNLEVKEILDNCKTRYYLQNTQDKELDTAVRLLQSGKILGWFQNGSEFGPRALGARSVLASPWAPYVKENLNDFIKHREWFRPFAIAVPEEDCSRYFKASSQCQFMNSVARVLPETNCLPDSFLLPGNRIRLQVVERKRNPLFWKLLKRFGEHAQAPMLINSSFNLRGEPLVVTPRDALRSYFASGLDALVIGNFVLCKGPLPTSLSNLHASNGVAIGV